MYEKKNTTLHTALEIHRYVPRLSRLTFEKSLPFQRPSTHFLTEDILFRLKGRPSERRRASGVRSRRTMYWRQRRAPPSLVLLAPN